MRLSSRLVLPAVVLAASGCSALPAFDRAAPADPDPKASSGPSARPALPVPGPEDAARRVRAAGLPLLVGEKFATHVHARVEIFIDGEPASVPAGIGIDPAGRWISPLHTHDASGKVHVESPEVRAELTLGQFYTVWTGEDLAAGGCLFSDDCPGAGRRWEFTVDGKARRTDPAGVVLRDGMVVTMTLGRKPDRGASPGPSPVVVRAAHAPYG